MSDTMICLCSPEGQAEAERLRIDVACRLGLKPEALALGVVDSIRQDFGAEWGVDCDQWFGVWFKAGEHHGYMECDLPLDGLAWAWQQLAAAMPDRAPARTVSPGDRAALEALSAQQLKEDAAADARWDAHLAACGGCETKTAWRLCSEGQQRWDESCVTARAINDKWGIPDDSEHPKWWGLATKEQTGDTNAKP